MFIDLLKTSTMLMMWTYDIDVDGTNGRHQQLHVSAYTIRDECNKLLIYEMNYED